MVHNDPDLIASGPSVQFMGRRTSPKEILQSYELWDDLPKNIKDCIKNHSSKGYPLKNNHFYIIGNNEVAVEGCLEMAEKLNYIPFILSTAIEGDVEQITETYTEFLINLKKFLKSEITKKEFEVKFPFNSNLFNEFYKTLTRCRIEEKPLCLILAGEPTVYIKGNGKGGRNQELALRMSIAFYENPLLEDICFLSAGTDGIDGPTDTAGAFGCSKIINEFLKSNTLDECKQFVLQNDSYNFYKRVNNGQFHIITGHTGTNVMDIHLLIVPTHEENKIYKDS